MKMKYARRESLTGALFAFPALAGIFIFFMLPFAVSVYYSLVAGIGSTVFVGFANYQRILQSSAFALAVSNTFKFIAVAVPLIMVFPLFLGILLQKQIRAASVFRSAFLLPLVVPSASTVLVFMILLSDQGALNQLLLSHGAAPVNWLSSSPSFFVLVVMYIWKYSGYNMVLYIAGLSSIPKEYYEAAEIDGASAPRKLLSITIPQLMPTIAFVLVMSVINSFKAFREAFFLMGNYPHNSVYLLQHFLNNNFQNLNYQRLSVAATLTAAFFLVTAGLFLAARGRGALQK